MAGCLDSVLKREGVPLPLAKPRWSTQTGASLPFSVSTPYRNTIPVVDETPMPGDFLWSAAFAV